MLSRGAIAQRPRQRRALVRQTIGARSRPLFLLPRLHFAARAVPWRAGADPRVYTQITDMSKLVKVVEEYLEDYNSVSNAPMKLVMFLDAIEHVSRITR